jgi:hypothetical protein
MQPARIKPHTKGAASDVKPPRRSSRTRSRLPCELELSGGRRRAGGETLSSQHHDKAAEDVVPTALRD